MEQAFYLRWAQLPFVEASRAKLLGAFGDQRIACVATEQGSRGDWLAEVLRTDKERAFSWYGRATNKLLRTGALEDCCCGRQVREQAVAAEKAGTQRYRARLRAAHAALEARLLAAWQQRQAAEQQRLESQRATAAADERAAQARLPIKHQQKIEL